MKITFKEIFIVIVDREESPLEPPRYVRFVRYPAISSSGILVAGHTSFPIADYKKMVKNYDSRSRTQGLEQI